MRLAKPLGVGCLVVLLAGVVTWRLRCQQAPPPVHPVEERFVGVWEADMLPVYAEMLGAAPDDPAFVEQMAEYGYAEELRADGTRTRRQSAPQQEVVEAGTWESLSHEGDAHRLRMTLEEGGGAFTLCDVLFESDERFVLTFASGAGDLDGKSVTFRLVGPPAGPPPPPE